MSAPPLIGCPTDAVTGEAFLDTNALTRLYCSLLRPKLVRKPATVMSPAKVCACSKASGIMVSTNMARRGHDLPLDVRAADAVRTGWAYPFLRILLDAPVTAASFPASC
jgi:hypothetical protein